MISKLYSVETYDEASEAWIEQLETNDRDLAVEVAYDMALGKIPARVLDRANEEYIQF